MSDRTIFKALSAVQKSLAEKGISKDQTNKFDNYKFRGIDDVLNAMAPILSANGVLILPSVTETDTRQVPTQKGGVQNHSKVKIDYTLYDEHGDSITHKAVGEAMDRGDKSINKAMSAAFKYFLFQAFCIPLQGQDADAESHDVSPSLPPDVASSIKNAPGLQELLHAFTEAWRAYPSAQEELTAIKDARKRELTND